MTFVSKYPLTPLGVVASFINGDRSVNYPKGEDYVDEGFPFISAADLDNGRVDYARVRQISTAAYDRLRSGKIQHKDILFCLRGSLGKMAYVQKQKTGAIASSLVIVRAAGSIDARYLFYTLSSQDAQQTTGGLNNGAAQPNLSVAELQRVAIPLPVLVVQQRIADILSAYDELIETSQRRIKILEAMVRGLYREWFVHFRFPGHECYPSMASASGAIPKGWALTMLKEVTSKIGSGATPRGGKDAYKAEGVHLIRSLNIYDYNFEFSNLALIDEKQAADLANVTVQKNDVLLNITGASVARCTLVPDYLIPARVNQHVAIVRADPTKISPFYLLDSINSDDRKQQLLTLAQGGATREALTKETLSNFQIVLPVPALIKRYDTVAGAIHGQRSILLRQVQKLRRTRDLLLPRLLSGQIDVDNLEHTL